MAEKQTNSAISPAGIMSAVVVTIGLISAGPSLNEAFQLTEILPANLKIYLLAIHNNKKFWIYIFLPIVLIIFWGLLHMIWRIIGPATFQQIHDARKDIVITTVDEDGNVFKGTAEEVERSIKRAQRFRLVLTLGLPVFRGWLLDRMKVESYGTFKRQYDWPVAPDRWHFVDRIRFTDGSGVEFQYLKDISALVRRSYSPDTRTYGPESKTFPKWREVLILLLASDAFCLWLILFLIKEGFLLWLILGGVFLTHFLTKMI